MKKHFSGKWIWINSNPQRNEYALFKEEFEYSGGTAVLCISAVTDYIVYINGETAAFGQFQGYRDLKYFDALDIRKFCKKGKNELRISVRYEGIDTAKAISDNAGVIYDLECGGKVVLRSSENTYGGIDSGYVQNTTQLITWELGYSSYMKKPEDDKLSKCVSADISCAIVPRPVKRCKIMPPVSGKLINKEKKIYDFGREYAGYLRIRVSCDKSTEIIAAYGEHIADGEVRRIIGERDFSVRFYCEKGENNFTQLYIRLGARYVQLISEKEFEVESVELIPIEYPIGEKPVKLSGTEKQIYDTCVRTLKLCMHEHYEDCPWREQALYVLDGRNQMLCGYYAFDSAEFQRANLIFMSHGKTEGGMLELTFPAVKTPSIPFFSVMYPVGVYEYVGHTGDKTIIPIVMETMRGIMNGFRERIDDSGLIPNLKKPFWNFYEWSEGSTGEYQSESLRYDLILNCAFLYSLDRFKKLCGYVNEEFAFEGENMKRAIERTFYNEEEGAYFASSEDKKCYTELGNSFAVLIGLDKGKIIDKLTDKSMIPVTLSMSCFLYDALLQSDRRYNEYVLNDIKEKYTFMLEKGATSFWETMKGDADFENAGSLCHGWSAMPIYYYNKLGVIE